MQKRNTEIQNTNANKIQPQQINLNQQLAS